MSELWYVTRQERELMRLIHVEVKRSGGSPLQRELADQLKVSSSRVCQLVRGLLARGMLARKGGHRGLRVGAATVRRFATVWNIQAKERRQ